MIRARKRSPRGSGELLADEILAAATELLISRGGEAGVSIRAVADAVGVTPPSIYLHFSDKEALLDAVCGRFFEQFDAYMMAASEGHDDVVERALAQGLAYVRFARENPVVFLEAFSRVTDAPTQTDEVLMASAFVHIGETVAQAMDEGLLRRADVSQRTLQLWAAAHGIAQLMTVKPGLPWGDDLTLAEGMLRAVFHGFAEESVMSESIRDDVR